MKYLTGITLTAISFLLLGCSPSSENPPATTVKTAEKTQVITALEVHSPNGLATMRFSIDEGKPTYEVLYGEHHVIAPSPLGLVLENTEDLAEGLQLVSENRDSNNSTWKPVWGTESEIVDHYQQLTVNLKETGPKARQINIELRAYDDGVAFRYVIPAQEGLQNFVINDEHTAFNFAADHEAYIGIMRDDGYGKSQQVEYPPMAISEFPADKLATFPALVNTGNVWAAITEAAVTDYADALLAPSTNSSPGLQIRLNRAPGVAQSEIPSTAPRVTPWRLIMLSENPGRFMEFNLIANLNEPSKLADTSWIKPGKAIWPWWNGRLPFGEPSTVQMKSYIDFAADQGLDSIVVDAGWYSTEEEAWDDPDAEDIFTMEETRVDYYDIHEVIKYASEKGVGVHLWVHGATLHRQMDEALDAFSKWGVIGIKADSWYGGDRGDYDAVRYFHDLLEKSAEKKIMINHHGWYKPTGISRTYPHLLTREAVLGLEHVKWSAKPTVEHDVMLAYTRGILGQMDYTPGAFDLKGTEKEPKQVQGTRAHQLAMYVVYFSPLQMLPDSPEVYSQNLGDFKFLRDVPTTWDDTKFISGDVAEYVAVARRSAEDWYVGVLTDNSERTIDLSLDFLSDGEYTAEIYRDADDAAQNPEHIQRETLNVSSTSTLTAKLAGGGGYAVRITPVSAP